MDGSKGVYVGESSRSMYERGKEHRKDGKDKAEDSHQWKHWALEHPGLDGDPQFRFKIVSSFSDPLTRQLAEAVRIERRGPEILNSRSEFSRCRVPRLRLDMETWTKSSLQEEMTCVEDPTVLAGDDELMDDLAEMEKDSRRMGRKRKEKDQNRKAKRRKMDKLVGWGEQQDDQSIHQEGVQDWLVKPTASPSQEKSQVLPVESRLKKEIEKSLMKDNIKPKDIVKEENKPTTFVFNKKGKIKKEESQELKRTHKDILEWVRKSRKKESAKMDNQDDDEKDADMDMKGQEELERELRLRMIKKKMASWEGLRFCQRLVMEVLERTLSEVQEVTVPACDPDKISRNTAKRDLLAERAVQPVQLTTTGNRPSKGPLVTLGHSNESPSTPLVYT